MTSVRALLLLLTLVCMPCFARAQSAQDAGAPAALSRLERAQRLFVEGVQAYDAGELDEALVKLREAYQLAPGPELGMHLGRVYERMGDAENALRLYRAALARRDLAATLRTEVTARIAVTEELARRQRDQIYATPPSSDELTAEARTFFSRGVTMFQQHKYDAALRAFMAAYQFAQLPEVIFNIARASERLHHTQDAIDYYVEYLRAAPAAQDRTFVEQKLRELRAR